MAHKRVQITLSHQEVDRVPYAIVDDLLSFMDDIDIAHPMRGTPEEVAAEMQRCLQQLAPGGYILTPANHLQADVPPANVVALVEAARRFGVYPLI